MTESTDSTDGENTSELQVEQDFGDFSVIYLQGPQTLHENRRLIEEYLGRVRPDAFKEYEAHGLQSYVPGADRWDFLPNTRYTIAIRRGDAGNIEIIGGGRVIVHEPNSGTKVRYETKDNNLSPEEMLPGAESQRYGELGGLAVLPDYRGQGIAPAINGMRTKYTLSDPDMHFLIGESVGKNLMPHWSGIEFANAHKEQASDRDIEGYAMYTLEIGGIERSVIIVSKDPGTVEQLGQMTSNTSTAARFTDMAKYRYGVMKFLDHDYALREREIIGDAAQYVAVGKITENCFEKLGGKLPVWASHDFRFSEDQSSRPDIKRVVITLHGMLANNEEYGQIMNDVVNEAGAENETLVLAPQFLRSCDREVEGFSPQHFYWHEDMGGWKHGYPALGPEPVSSFSLMDELVKEITNSNKFPNLEEIVIAGNSAGSQLGVCYALAGNAQEIVESASDDKGQEIGLRYVMSNSSNYPYVTEWRPEPVEEAGAAFNHWPYGLENPPPYVEAALQTSSKEELIKRFAQSNINLLLGRRDNQQTTGLRVDKVSMTQGKERLERGEKYHEHWWRIAKAARLPLNLKLTSLDAGHNARDLWSTPRGKAALLDTPLSVFEDNSLTRLSAVAELKWNLRNVRPNTRKEAVGFALDCCELLRRGLGLSMEDVGPLSRDMDFVPAQTRDNLLRAIKNAEWDEAMEGEALSEDTEWDEVIGAPGFPLFFTPTEKAMLSVLTGSYTDKGPAEVDLAKDYIPEGPVLEMMVLPFDRELDYHPELSKYPLISKREGWKEKVTKGKEKATKGLSTLSGHFRK